MHRNALLRSGLNDVGFFGINAPYLTCLCIVLFSVLGVLGLLRLKVDDHALRTVSAPTPRSFGASEEIATGAFPPANTMCSWSWRAKTFSRNRSLQAFRRAIIDLQLADGVDGLVSMLSARGKPDASGYAAPIVPDELPDDAPSLWRHHQRPEEQRDRCRQVPLPRW